MTSWATKYNAIVYDSVLVFFRHDEAQHAHRPSAPAATIKSPTILTKTTELVEEKSSTKICDKDKGAYMVVCVRNTKTFWCFLGTYQNCFHQKTSIRNGGGWRHCKGRPFNFCLQWVVATGTTSHAPFFQHGHCGKML